jgi:hypothetical protein
MIDVITAMTAALAKNRNFVVRPLIGDPPFARVRTVRTPAR